MKTALSIAGSDCSGGAGIQADLKTMTLNGVFAMSAITALTAQNTTGVSGILEVSPALPRTADRRGVYRHPPRRRQDRDGILPPRSLRRSPSGCVSIRPGTSWWTPSWWPPQAPA